MACTKDSIYQGAARDVGPRLSQLLQLVAILEARTAVIRRVVLPISDRYKAACANYVRQASERPGMFFRSLDDFESQMHGHAVAFIEFGDISGSTDRFNSQFGNWLYQNFQLSCCSGWAYAINRSTESEDHAEAKFFELVEEFLEQW